MLNAKPGVGDEVRNAVIAAMDMLGYERPATIKTKARGLIGVVVPELINPIFPAFAQTIETLLDRAHPSPMAAGCSCPT